MKKIIIILLCLSIYSCGNSEKSEDYYLVGINHYKNKNYSEALKAFEQDYKLKDNINSLYKLSEIFFETNDIFNSEIYLKKILEKNISDGFANYKLGFLYKKLGKYDESVIYLSKLLGNKEYQENAFYNLIEIYIYSNQIEEALRLYEMSLKSIETSDKIEYLLTVYLLKKNDANYKKHFDIIIQKSQNYSILNKLTDALLNFSKIEEALQTLLIIEKQFPKNIDTLATIGQIYMISGEYEKALEYFLKVEQVDINNVPNKLNFAAVYIYLYDYLRAEKYLTEAIGLKTDSIEALFLTGFLFYLKKDFEKSEKILKTIEKNILPSQFNKFKTNLLITFYLSLLNYDNYKPSKEEILEFQTGINPQLFALKLSRLNDSGLYKEVLDLYKKENLENVLIYEQLFVAHLMLGNEKEAKEIITKLTDSKEIYQIWFDYTINKKCNIPADIEKYKQSHIFTDIYTDCLIKEKKYKEAKDFLNEFISKNKVQKETSEYLKNKILFINFNILKD